MRGLVAIGCVLAGCSGAKGPAATAAFDATRARTAADHGPTPSRVVEPSAATKQLWKKIDGYRAWPRFSESAEPRVSRAHGEAWVVGFFNRVVRAAMNAEDVPLGDDAILVLEERAEPNMASTRALSVMWKRGSSWYWVEATPDGRVLVDQKTGEPLEGAVATCAECHSAKSANDFVFTHEFRR